MQNFLMEYPNFRARRTRKSEWIREILSETKISPSDLILPIFIKENISGREEIKTMPDVFRHDLNSAINEIEHAKNLGIKAVALFPAISNAKKTECASEAFNSDNLICLAIKKIKDKMPEIGIIADVALDPFTSHGHDGILENGEIVNDKTIEILCKQSLAYAKSGADIIAPSDMMDGRIGKIRTVLEQENFANTMILSYSAKYASNFYGPFRDAVESKNNLKNADKKTYQMNPQNALESMHEIAMDIKEGADMVMIKPAIFYLDIIKKARENFSVPIFAYQVSGEYSMLKLGALNGLFSYEQAMLENLTAIKRAGANAILTYAASHIAKFL